MNRNIILFIIFVLIVAGGYLFFQRDTANAPENSEVLETHTEIANSREGRQCYTYAHEAEEGAPYAVRESLDITISENIVTGTKEGTQKGPDVNNGYNGTISGTLDGNTITSIFSYTVEGSENKEKEIYIFNDTGLQKMRYPLIEENGVLIPDISKDPNILLYSRVEC